MFCFDDIFLLFRCFLSLFWNNVCFTQKLIEYWISLFLFYSSNRFRNRRDWKSFDFERLFVCLFRLEPIHFCFVFFSSGSDRVRQIDRIYRIECFKFISIGLDLFSFLFFTNFIEILISETFFFVSIET